MPFKPPARYAIDTKVPAMVTRAEIETLIVKYGADSFAYGQDGVSVFIGFRLAERTLKFTLKLPDQRTHPKEHRSRWRALLLCIKAKLESVATGIESFDQAFMPHVVMPNGKTFSEYAMPALEEAYAKGKMPPLLTFQE